MHNLMTLLLPTINSKQAALVTLHKYVMERFPDMDPQLAYYKAVAAITLAGAAPDPEAEPSVNE